MNTEISRGSLANLAAKGYLLISATDSRSNGLGFTWRKPRPAGHRREVRRGGAIDDIAGVHPKHVSVHHSSKGKRQGKEKLTADRSRALAQPEKEQRRRAVMVARARARRDPVCALSAARARIMEFGDKREPTGWIWEFYRGSGKSYPVQSGIGGISFGQRPAR